MIRPLMFMAIAAPPVSTLPTYASADSCADAMTTADMRQCAYESFQAADAELNRVYKQARAAAKAADALHGEREDSGAVFHLRQAQRAWIQLRDAECVLAGFPFRGGTMESVLVTSCHADLTRKRTEELQDLAEMLRL